MREYVGYKLQFSTALHIGSDQLEDAESVIYADTLFSSLCHAALACGGEEQLNELVSMVDKNQVRISDAYPFYEDRYYIPKPMVRIKSGTSGDSVQKKALKKLHFIPVDQFEPFLGGKMDVKHEAEILSRMGASEIRTMASVSECSDTQPFSVGAYSFERGWGLYFIVGYEETNARMMVEELLECLEFEGIGGKRSAGLGKFTAMPAKLPESLLKRLCTEKKEGKYMTISVSMAEEHELESTLEDASYMLVRRGGFIASATYGPELQKKQDTYLFKGGSVFSRTFDGIIRDVSGEGSHAVYKYAKPIFMEVK